MNWYIGNKFRNSPRRNPAYFVDFEPDFQAYDYLLKNLQKELRRLSPRSQVQKQREYLVREQFIRRPRQQNIHEDAGGKLHFMARASTLTQLRKVRKSPKAAGPEQIDRCFESRPRRHRETDDRHTRTSRIRTSTTPEAPLNTPEVVAAAKPVIAKHPISPFDGQSGVLSESKTHHSAKRSSRISSNRERIAPECRVERGDAINISDSVPGSNKITSAESNSVKHDSSTSRMRRHLVKGVRLSANAIRQRLQANTNIEKERLASTRIGGVTSASPEVLASIKPEPMFSSVDTKSGLTSMSTKHHSTHRGVTHLNTEKYTSGHQSSRKEEGAKNRHERAVETFQGKDRDSNQKHRQSSKVEEPPAEARLSASKRSGRHRHRTNKPTEAGILSSAPIDDLPRSGTSMSIPVGRFDFRGVIKMGESEGSKEVFSSKGIPFIPASSDSIERRKSPDVARPAKEANLTTRESRHRTRKKETSEAEHLEATPRSKKTPAPADPLLEDIVSTKLGKNSQTSSTIKGTFSGTTSSTDRDVHRDSLHTTAPPLEQCEVYYGYYKLFIPPSDDSPEYHLTPEQVRLIKWARSNTSPDRVREHEDTQTEELILAGTPVRKPSEVKSNLQFGSKSSRCPYLRAEFLEPHEHRRALQMSINTKERSPESNPHQVESDGTNPTESPKHRQSLKILLAIPTKEEPRLHKRSSRHRGGTYGNTEANNQRSTSINAPPAEATGHSVPSIKSKRFDIKSALKFEEKIPRSPEVSALEEEESDVLNTNERVLEPNELGHSTREGVAMEKSLNRRLDRNQVGVSENTEPESPLSASTDDFPPPHGTTAPSEIPQTNQPIVSGYKFKAFNRRSKYKAFLRISKKQGKQFKKRLTSNYKTYEVEMPEATALPIAYLDREVLRDSQNKDEQQEKAEQEDRFGSTWNSCRPTSIVYNMLALIFALVSCWPMAMFFQSAFVNNIRDYIWHLFPEEPAPLPKSNLDIFMEFMSLPWI